ncbi:MAG: lytic transglycosylase domain-containing protein [Candidatus Eremiobacterota bacterium]
MKKVLGSLALILLGGIGFSGGAYAQEAVYATTQYENGQAVRVYTNPEAQNFRRVMRVRRNSANDGAFIVNVPTVTSLARRRPRGPIPKLYSYEESAYKELPRRPLVYAVKVQREGRTVSETEIVNLSDIILKEAREHNVDPLIVELIIKHESNFNHLAVSRSGAQGLMQLMPGTAAGLGVSDSFDPAQNVAGGVEYFAAQLSRFQDLRLALAAYNAGPGAVEAAGGIPPYAETVEYVARITAEYENRKAKRSVAESE